MCVLMLLKLNSRTTIESVHSSCSLPFIVLSFDTVLASFFPIPLFSYACSLLSVVREQPQ